MQLSEFQDRFKALMLDHPKMLDNPPEELAGVFASGDIPLPARLKVYRHNIIGSLTDLMAAGFPLTENLVGKEFFEGMARSFILESPPSQGCLSFYGEEFDAFIKRFEPAASLPYLPDVARLEIAFNAAYYAKDDAPLHADDLASIAPEELGDLKIESRDAVQLLKSDYPLLKIRAFCLSDNHDEPLDIDQGGGSVMVYRKDFESMAINITDDEYLMLSHLQDGRSLGEALENVLNSFQGFDFQSFLEKHLSLETFTAFRRT